MATNSKQFDAAISWERVRAIFGNADPPQQVWEKQFDYFDEDLKRLAATSYRDIDRNDLWYYFHDLAYSELQLDLFHYLFPVCLMEWHDTLSRNEACSQGDSEFHWGMKRGNVLEKMLTSEQQEKVVDFFRDSFLQRIDAEPVTIQPSLTIHPFGWICRFNSLGLILPYIDRIWEPWWKIETRGRTVAVLKYCSGLCYFEGENKPFGIPTLHTPGLFGPNLYENDSFIHGGWLEPNVQFLRNTLSFDYVLQKLELAAARLQGEPEHDLAQLVLSYTVRNRELVESRIAELPLLLGDNGATREREWSV